MEKPDLNSHGQLGGGGIQQTSHPIKSNFGITSISTGGGFTILLKSDGTVWATGSNYSGRLGDGTNIHRFKPPVQVKNDGWQHIYKCTDDICWARSLFVS